MLIAANTFASYGFAAKRLHVHPSAKADSLDRQRLLDGAGVDEANDEADESADKVSEPPVPWPYRAVTI